MDTRVQIAQITNALPGNPLTPRIFKLVKPDANQAITIGLDGTVEIDLSSIANTPVTFVHAGDRLVILFDNNATITLEPFFKDDGTPLSNITVDLAPDRSVTGAEFASLFPITQDQSVLPTAGNGTPSSGADFQTVVIDQLAGGNGPLPLLGPDSPNGNAPGPNGNGIITISALVQGPALTVHAAAGNEDKAIALNITDVLSIADPRTSLGNITITGFPADVTFNHGTLSPDGKTLTLTPDQLAGLTLTSDGEVQHFTLTVTATTHDGTITATSTATVNVDVTPVANAPTLAVTNVSGNEDHATALNLQSALTEADADAVLTVSITGVPAGVTFNQGTLSPDGKTLTLTPAQLTGLTLTSDGDVQHFDLTVKATTVDGGDTATAASTTATLHVDVTPVADPPNLDVEHTRLVFPNATTIDAPKANLTEALGVNNSGTIVGFFFDPKGEHGLIEQGGSFSPPVDLTNESQTFISGINNGGELTGFVFDSSGEHGFVEQRTTVTKIDFPSALSTQANGINDSGEIIGQFLDASGNQHGFFRDASGNLSAIDVQGARETLASGINNSDQIVGAFQDARGIENGFLDINGVFTTIDVPGAILTDATGIDSKGDIVGFFEDRAGIQHGFFRDTNGNFSTIDIAGSNLVTVSGINDSGEVVGTFSSQGTFHGFTAVGSVITESGVSGIEDTPLALGIKASLSEVDADAVLTVTIAGLPISGVTLSNAHGDKLTIDPTGSITLTADQLAGLALTSDGETQHFNLTVTATTVDGGDTATAASTTATLTVDFTPVADPPNFPAITAHASEGGQTADSATQTISLTVNPAVAAPVLAAADATAATTSVNEDSNVALNITPHFASDPSAVNTITIDGLPSGATLTNANGDTFPGGGPIVLSPAQLAGLTLHTGDDDTSSITLPAATTLL